MKMDIDLPSSPYSIQYDDSDLSTLKIYEGEADITDSVKKNELIFDLINYIRYLIMLSSISY